MSKRGRYGKYGETKRFERLRQSKTRSALASQRDLKRQTHSRRQKRPPKQSPLAIRPAMPWDASFIRTLSRDQFSQYGPYDDILSEWLESGAVLAFTALHEAKVIGFALLGQVPHGLDSSDVWEIVAIAVLTQHQRQGVGSALLHAVIEAARERQASLLILHTATDNQPAQNLFRKLGFEVFQHRAKFYPAGQDALMMRRPLSPATG